MPKLFNESPAFTTSDLVNALSRERDKKLPVRSSFFNALVPQVKAQDAAINRPDPVERASMLPFATYPDGSTRLALPGMIAEDIPRAFTAPARAYRGEIPDEDMISEGLNFAGNMAMTGSIAPKPSNAAGMFGGRLGAENLAKKGETRPLRMLDMLDEMQKAGATREEIWDATTKIGEGSPYIGAHSGVDKIGRFEIDDSKAVVYPGYLEQTGKWEHAKPFRDVMDHYNYLSAYPDAENITMQRIGGQKINGGGYSDGRMWFNASGIDRGRNIALHELQHDAQMREGFARGGSARQFTDAEIAAERSRRNTQESDNGWSSVGTYDPSISDEAIARDLYSKLAGETEARAVQARSYLNPEERSARPPWLDYDVPENQQIVRFGNEGTSYSLDTNIARQIHEAQRAANPAADPNRLAQIARKGNEWEVSSPVGNIVAYDAPHGVQIKGAGLDEGVPKGMGYGMPLYETLANEAAAAGKPVASDQIVSRPAQNVYGAMSRRGYDVQGPPANALRHPDSGSLIANEPIYSVSAPNVAPREMPPPLPDNILYANSKSSGVPGALTAQAAEQARPRVPNPMPMDVASRTARAKQMGFDTDTTWYHGTSTPGLTELKPGMRDPGIWVTDDKMNANNYARGSDADLHSLRARYSNPYIVEFGDDMSPTNMGSSIPFDNNVDIVKHAFNNGYDAVHFPYGNFSESGNTIVLRNGNQLRDILAEFDLEKSGSANLLSINPKYSGLAGVMMVDDKNKKKKN